MSQIDTIFRANELTHPTRATSDGRKVVEVVDHGGVSASVLALSPADLRDPRDHIRYGVRFEGKSWNDKDGSQWATPREIGRWS